MRVSKRLVCAIGVFGACVAGGLIMQSASVAQSGSEPLGRTTVQLNIDGATSRDQGYARLRAVAGRARVVRTANVGTAVAGRQERRRSLLSFGQLSDFQLADEETPARVEFFESTAEEPLPDAFGSAGRPQEAMHPQIDNEAIEQMNRFTAAGPIPDGGGGRAPMNFAITTGDSADNQQLNEVETVVKLLEGGRVDPNSGSSNPAEYATCPPGTPGPAEAAGYTGVQDYTDYAAGAIHYDPNRPSGVYADFPKYPGLMDRAQAQFDAAGLKVPSYVALGNHDGLVQGNAAANASFDAIAVGCIKPMTPAPTLNPLDILNPTYVQQLLVGNPAKALLVPPDSRRTFVSKAQYKALHRTGKQGDAHGFGHVDAAELAASKGAASYYAWSPTPAFRFVALDTVSDAGVAGPSAEGNLDDPQFKWLEGQLKEATRLDQLAVLFGHHPIRSMGVPLADEMAPPCTGVTIRGHDANPGCDVDPRSSTPIHTGPDLVALLHSYPHAIAYVAGHTHQNRITPFPGPKPGTGFWGIETASEADWPQQSRLLEVMNNFDSTLSIFGTVLDHGAPIATPPAGTSAATFTAEQLASIGREIAFNDRQQGGKKGGQRGPNESTAQDDNVELLVGDPRREPLRHLNASGCRDKLSPRTTIDRKTLRATRKGVSLNGISKDRGCSSTPGRVARMEVAIGRQVPGGCRWLTASGRFTAKRSCRKPVFRRGRVAYSRPRGQSSWSLAARAAMPRGRFELEARGVDPRGNPERLKRAARVVRFFSIR